MVDDSTYLLPAYPPIFLFKVAVIHLRLFNCKLVSNNIQHSLRTIDWPTSAASTEDPFVPEGVCEHPQ